MVTVVVTVPPGPFVTVVVSPDEDEDAVDADVAETDAGLAAAAEPVDAVELVETLGVPSAATALFRLLLMLLIFIMILSNTHGDCAPMGMLARKTISNENALRCTI